MPKERVRTVMLGQFTHEHAEAIAKELSEAEIQWYFKQSGGIGQVLFRGDWGVRLFVDAAKADEVRAIVERVAARFKP